VPVTSSLATEPGLGGAGQQDWCLLGRVWQRGHGKNVLPNLVMGLRGPCSVPCPAPVLLPLADHLSVFQLSMDPMVWGSCPSSILPHHMLEVGALGQGSCRRFGITEGPPKPYRGSGGARTCLLGAKAVGGGAHPRQSLGLKAKLLSLRGLGPPCWMSPWVPCYCTLPGWEPGQCMVWLSNS